MRSTMFKVVILAFVLVAGAAEALTFKKGESKSFDGKNAGCLAF